MKFNLSGINEPLATSLLRFEDLNLYEQFY